MDKSLSTTDIRQQLLSLTKQFLTDSGAERARLAVTLHASLEKDLGIGSLEKAELFRRIEKAFDIRFEESILIHSQNLADIVTAIQEKKPAHELEKVAVDIHLEATHADLSQAQTLIDVLKLHAESEPDRPHIYLQDEEGHETIIRYGELYNEAEKVAKGLIKQGIEPGETIAIMLPTCADFFSCFFGVLLAGAIPVPIYPPLRPDQIEEYARREALILKNASVRILITFQQAETLSRLLRSFIPSLKAVTTVTALKIAEGKLPDLDIGQADPAFIQYTSGSTGNPKGVLLTHANLLANIRAFGKAIQVKPNDVVVSWLPLYHDMGLIGTWFGSLYYGNPLVVMSPLTFLTRPERWLWTLHIHQGTISAGPNFAYELCVKRIDKKALEGLDLSSWRLAFNGAEAIYSQTLKNFTKKFSPYGFKEETFFPVFGLAECCVALTFPPVGRAPRIDRISREAYEKEHKAIPLVEDDKQALEFVCCGSPIPDHEIRIVNEVDEILPERSVGKLQFRGPSAMQGYYRNEEATNAIYHNGWWDTGDLAYIADGEVYITGRIKDVIIKAGRSIYPPEIEEIASQVPGVRKGCVAAVGVKAPARGTEQLVIIAETAENEAHVKERMTTELIEKISASLGMPPDHIVLVPPHTIPKTSSGKLRRAATLELYMQGKLTKLGTPPWMQMLKLFFVGVGRKISFSIKKMGRIIYTLYVLFITAITLGPLWLSLRWIPDEKVAEWCRRVSRLTLLLCGLPLTVEGSENIPDYPVIYVANHASYIDSVVLLATMPRNSLIVAKKELMETKIFGSFLRELGFLTIDRFDFSQSIADTERIKQTLQSRKSVIIFPEGTFSAVTGLRPFQLGAFKIAVETGIPICPMALQGTRRVLRGSERLFRPSRIKVHFSAPMASQSKEWSEVIRLRDAARTEIAKYCGEPVLYLIRAGIRGRE